MKKWPINDENCNPIDSKRSKKQKRKLTANHIIMKLLKSSNKEYLKKVVRGGKKTAYEQRNKDTNDSQLLIRNNASQKTMEYN